MLITRTSQWSGKTHTLDLDVTQEQMERFENRIANKEYVQTIFPHLSKAEREFILTGVTDEEWDTAFPKEVFPQTQLEEIVSRLEEDGLYALQGIKDIIAETDDKKDSKLDSEAAVIAAYDWMHALGNECCGVLEKIILKIKIFKIRTSAYSEEDFYLLTDLSEAAIKSVIRHMVIKERESDVFYTNQDYVDALKFEFPKAKIILYHDFPLIEF